LSLTGAHHAFAGVSEDGVNKIVQAFFSARPRHLHYGTTPFVASTTIGATNVATIAFPGIPGGISYMVDLSIPQIDLFPADGPLPAPLVLGADQLSIRTKARVTLGCLKGDGASEKRGTLTPVSTELEVWAIGHPAARTFSPGVGDISFHVDEVKVTLVEPATLEAVLDCLLRMILNGVLSSLQLPFTIINVDFFKLILEEGPLIAADQIEVRGDVV
jgi:hypothetical protein